MAGFGSLPRMLLASDLQKRLKDQFWREVVGDPKKYGDVIGEARRLVAYHEGHAETARKRLQYLLSLKEET